MDLTIPAGYAQVFVTYNGRSGDLPDPVSVDATDGDLKAWVTEAVRTGNIQGIPADPNANFTDYVVDRFPASDVVSYPRISLRPKTSFG